MVVNKKKQEWVSDISRKYPSFRNAKPKSVESWLAGKRQDDGAEGFWRIKDTLYDFSNFIDIHPGGAFWLRETQNTDITEFFEAHHLSLIPEHMLEKFVVRKATSPRNITLTMHENGFYKTLKSRVRDKLKEIDYSPRKRTNFMHLGLLLSTFAFGMLSAYTRSTLFEMLTALAMCWLVISAHNYFHRRDNWQMYTFNVGLLNVCAWRISHALSHHAYPNSLHDLELSMFEPLFCWVPSEKYSTKIIRIISVIMQPLVYAAIFPISFITRVFNSIFYTNVMYWHDIIGFILPTLMLFVTTASFIDTIRQWFFIVCLSSFIFAVISVNGAHHDPQIYHDGDAYRPDRDWGIFQLDTLIDWREIKGSQFMTLTHFGDHALHHLFPTLDHGILPQLYPILEKTMKEFQLELRENNHLEQIIGQSKQLLRTTPNPIPPGGKKTT